MNNPEMEQIEINGVQLVRVGQRGPIILYLHHAGQPPMGNPDHILALAREGQVIAPNMYDLAASVKRDRVKNPNFGHMAGKFNQLGLVSPGERIHFVTCSWGSSLAFRYAAQEEKAVASITAASPTGWPIERSAVGWFGAFIRDNIQKLSQVPADLQRRDLGASLFMRQIFRNGAGAMWYALKMTMAADDREVLPKVQCHVELLSSTRDHYVPASGAMEMKRQLPHSRLRLVSNLNHLWYVFEPEKFFGAAIEQIRQTA